MERRGDRLRDLVQRVTELGPIDVQLDALRVEAEDATQALMVARKTLDEAQKEVGETRRRRIEVGLEREDLRTFAEITLRHLGEICPVCQQTYDIDETRERLRLLAGDSEYPAEPSPDELNLSKLLEDIQSIEKRATSADAALRYAQRQERVRVESQEGIRADLAELSIDVPATSSSSRAIESALEEDADTLKKLSEVALEGEAIALALARAGQLARQDELQAEVQGAKRDLADIQNEIASRRYTGELVSRMIDGLRNASSELVERELVRLEPLLRRIYATADPHPEFRVVKLLSRMYRGSGQVVAELEDPLRDHHSEDPRAYLSSSQMNVLAVSVFLALNLGIPTLPLRTAILDDPLQSLDDINLLGLVDLLKRIRERRQLMVSTHDNRFASLLERKLRPVSETQRTILIEMSGWTGEGPTVTQRDVAGDVVPIRIAAA